MSQLDIKVMTAHVPSAMAAEIDRYAAQQDRSRAWVIKQALADWLERERERTRMTLEGLDSVAAGRVVDHARVVAWSQSLATGDPLPLPASEP
jgi:predicted transcriptional regulator